MNNEKYNLLLQRKSVRHFTDEPIPKQAIELLLKAAMAAPSAKNRQPWAFIAITSKKTLVEIASGLPFGKMLEKTNAAIVVCGNLSKTKEEDGDRWKLDCSAASENILLAAEALLLGAVWVGIYPEKERIEHLSNILDLPPYIVPLNIIPLGVPSREETAKDKFNTENIRWEKWG